MKNIRFIVLAGVLVILIFSGCEDQWMTKNTSVELAKNRDGGFEGPGTYSDHSSGDRYPYPEIIHQVFIPENDMWDRKTLAWRITWPVYADDADPEKIPTVWSGNGILNSIDYLNNVDPQNTYNTLFSLYFDETIQRSRDMASELDHVAGAPNGSMDTVEFNDMWITASGLQKMAETDASGFQMYWQLVNKVDELEYEDEDILFYKIGGPTEFKLYGAIRIVSIEPRIIEVFLAVPNDLSLVDDFAE
jgi:hypothetical protein